MWSVLFSIGPITVYSFGFLLAIGFFFFSFLSWRRLREMGLEEEKAVDLLLILTLWSFLFARLGFVLTHFGDFGFSFERWVLLSRFPGLSFWGTILGGLWALRWFCRRSRWEFWRVADELTFGFLPLVILIYAGSFFDGSFLGTPTSMPWGMFFPGDFIRRQPISLFGVLIFFLIWLFFLRVERSWRTWEWYKSSAEGFITLLFLALTLLVAFLLAFWEEGRLYFLVFKRAGSFLSFLGVLFLLYRHSEIRLGEALKQFLTKRRLKKENDKLLRV